MRIALVAAFLFVAAASIEAKIVCTGSGDTHYNNFDGSAFHFQGVGDFELVKTKRIEVQARAIPCGKHATYGVVSCITDVAIRYIDAATGLSSYVQFSSGGSVLKVNKADVAFPTTGVRIPVGSSGAYVYRSNKAEDGLTGMRSKFVAPTGEQVINVGDFFTVILPDDQKGKAVGLCGHGDGNQQADFSTGFAGQSFKINVKNAADLNGNSYNKDIHKWGLTFMVNDKTIKSAFASKAALFDRPDDTPLKTFAFKTAALQKQAEAACTRNALNAQFYKDCMEDIAATGQINEGKMDKDAQAVINNFKTQSAYSDSKTKILQILSNFEIELEKEKAALLSKKEEAQVAALTTQVSDLRKVQATKDAKVANLNTQVATLDKTIASLNTAITQGQAKLKEVQAMRKKATNSIDKEIALVKELQSKLQDLVNVNLQDVDMSSRVGKALSALLQESDSRERVGHTDVIRKVLGDLLNKLIAERAGLGADEAKVQTDLNKATADLKSSNDKRAAAAASVKVAQDEAKVAKAAADNKDAQLKQATIDLAASQKRRAARLAVIEQEFKSIQFFRRKVVEWMNKSDITSVQLDDDAEESDPTGGTTVDEDSDDAFDDLL